MYLVDEVGPGADDMPSSAVIAVYPRPGDNLPVRVRVFRGTGIETQLELFQATLVARIVELNHPEAGQVEAERQLFQAVFSKPVGEPQWYDRLQNHCRLQSLIW